MGTLGREVSCLKSFQVNEGGLHELQAGWLIWRVLRMWISVAYLGVSGG